MNKSGLLRYALKRILIAIPVLIGITLLDFLIMSFAGSPLDMMIGPRVSQSAIDAKAIQLGLDQPFFVQYWVWLKQIFVGNLGFSIKTQQPVLQIISEKIGPTLLLTGAALVLSLLFAIPAGIYSAVNQYKKSDYAIVSFSFMGTSIPSFFFSLLLIYIFHVVLGVLPAQGMIELGGSGGWGDVIRHMILPTIVLAFSTVGSNIRYIRSAMLEIMQKDYLVTARAKGISRKRIIYRHALKNALVPIITVIGMQVPMLFAGAVVVEKVFSWPGLGLLTMQSILDRDFPLIMGIALLTATVVLITNILTDLLYALVDPTIRYD